MRRSRPLAYYGGQAILTAALLAVVVPFCGFPLRVPFDYSGDGLFFTAIVKGVAEEGPFRFSRIGAPFGADVVDWPMGMWLPLAVTTALSHVLGHPGTVVNVTWLLAVVLAGVTAAWALRRLDVPPRVAFVFGLLYAFVPYAFYKNVTHFGTFFPFVPPVALLALRLAGDGLERQDARERWVTLAACLAQGFSYVYYAFFGCFLLVAAGSIGWARTRRPATTRLAAAGVLLLTLGAAIPLAPSVAYWSRHGRNTRLEYKQAADAESYGLKLRQLLVPIEGHPLAPLRRVQERIAEARFPNENENATARLGLVGSIGLLALLGAAVARVAGAGGGSAVSGAAAALTLCALLLAQIGGLGSLFSVFVSPDIRGYSRIVVYVAFFSFYTSARLFSRAIEALPAAITERAGGWLGLALVLAFGVLDQVPRLYLTEIRTASAPQFQEDEAFVALVEGRLPRGAMVFQLPHGTIPLDLSFRPPMNPYDPGRAYVSSRSLRWSWGSILGRTGDWQAAVARLPPALMARRLALAGFSGIWIDRRGYDAPPRIPWSQLEAALAEATGTAPLSSAEGRYSLLPLDPLRERLGRELGEAALAAARREALGDVRVLFPTWREGCDLDAAGATAGAATCGPSSWLVFKNDENLERAVVVSGTLEPLAPGRLTVTIGDRSSVLELGGGPTRFEREATIPAARKLRLELAFDGACPVASGSTRCLRVSDITAAVRDAPGPAAP